MNTFNSFTCTGSKLWSFTWSHISLSKLPILYYGTMAHLRRHKHIIYRRIIYRYLMIEVCEKYEKHLHTLPRILGRKPKCLGFSQLKRTEPLQTIWFWRYCSGKWKRPQQWITSAALPLRDLNCGDLRDLIYHFLSYQYFTMVRWHTWEGISISFIDELFIDI